MRSIKFIIALILICIWSTVKVSLSNTDECSLNADLFADIDTWNISHNTVPAQLLWQKSETNTRLGVHLGSQNTSFIATEDTVIYWQPIGVPLCDQTPIVVGIDAQTGAEKWRYESADGFVTKIFLVKNGYLLLNISSITKLDLSGKVIWRQEAGRVLPFRSFVIASEIDDSIFLLTTLSGMVYELSTDTGEFIRVLENHDVVGFWGNYALLKVSDHELQLRTIGSRSESLYTLQFPKSRFQNTPLNSLFPFAERYGDILFLFFEGSRVEAYNFLTGTLLWQAEVPMYGTPAFVGHHLILYRLDQTLEIRDPQTGDIVATAELKRDQGSDLTTTQISSPISIWITGNSDTLFVRQIDQLELVALKVDLTSIK